MYTPQDKNIKALVFQWLKCIFYVLHRAAPRSVKVQPGLHPAVASDQEGFARGNWEHWSGVDFAALQASLAGAGGRLVLNDRWTLSKQGRTLQLIGLDDFTAGAPDLRLLTSGVSADAVGMVDTVLVPHSPGFFDHVDVSQRLGDNRFSVCLSGHTHGGQVALAGWAPWLPRGSGRFVAGFYDVPGCRLFVSRGVGMSVLPLRLGAPPEVVVFEL